MRCERFGVLTILMAGMFFLGAASVAEAGPTDCTIDYDGDTLGTITDFGPFLAAWNAGSSAADLNGDLVVDGFDVQTFFAYLGFTPCPIRAEYQYNRVVDTVDQIFFTYLWTNSSLRADLDGDGLTTAADVAAFISVNGMAY